MYSFCFAPIVVLVSLSSQFEAFAVLLVSFDKVMIFPLSLTFFYETCIEARAHDQDGDNFGAINGLKKWLIQNHVVVKQIEIGGNSS